MPNAWSFAVAFGLIVPVSTDWMTPGRPATAATASFAPGSARPRVGSRSSRDPNAIASSLVYLPSSSWLPGSAGSGTPPELTSLSARASKKISESVRPAVCGSATSGRPVTRRNASA